MPRRKPHINGLEGACDGRQDFQQWGRPVLQLTEKLRRWRWNNVARNLTGTTLNGRYRFEALVGQGTFAQVYRVHDLRRGTDLAAKVLRQDMAMEATFVERFRREASVLEKLQHPHIVRYYGTEEVEGVAFILLDYIKGTNLQAYIYSRSQPFEVEESLKIVRPVTSALTYAHGEGVIHRDIKPGNILLGDNGGVYVTDFGIARILTDNSAALTMGESIGTPLYMAPEQIRSSGAITIAADVYALGVVLYQMYVGQVPFRGQSEGAVGDTVSERVAYEHLNVPPPAPSQLNPSLSPAVGEVLLKALAKNPAQRFATIPEFYSALTGAAGIAQTSPVKLEESDPYATIPPAAPLPPDVTLPEWSQVVRRAQAGEPDAPPSDDPYSTIDAPLGGRQTLPDAPPAAPPPDPAAAATIASSRPTNPRMSPVQDPYAQTMPTMQGPLGNLEDTSPAVATSPRRPVYPGSIAAPEDSYDRRRRFSIMAAVVVAVLIGLCVLAVIIASLATRGDDDDQEPEPGVNLPIAQEPATGILYSDSVINQLDIFAANTDGSNARRLTLTGTSNESGAVYSPNGQMIAYYSYTTSNAPADIWVMDADGENKRRITDTPRVDEREITWSPDSTRLAYHSNEEGNYDIFVYDLGSSEARNITNSSSNDYAPAWSLYNRIAFHSDREGSVTQLYVMDADGSGVERLTNGDQNAEFPAWTPDGSRLVFQLRSGDETQLRAINGDGGGLQPLFAVNSNERFAHWRNNHTLVYMAGDDAFPSIMQVDFEAGQIRQLSTRGRSPDGRPS